MRVSASLGPTAIVLCFLSVCANLPAQNSNQDGSRDYSREPYVVEKIASRIHCENDGKYQTESEVRVRVQSALGVRDWGIIRAPYGASTEDAEIANVRVIEPDGKVISTPPEDVQDVPAPITVAAPVYSDLKEKQLAVRGLEPGDVLEYRETSQVRTPLIPGQFWLNYNFFKAGVALDEELQIWVPRDRYVKIKSPKVKPAAAEENGDRVYTWKTSNLETKADRDAAKSNGDSGQDSSAAPFADVQLTTFRSWEEVGQWYRGVEEPQTRLTPAIRAKAAELTRGASSDKEKIRALYRYVATKFRYVGVAFGVGRYQPHTAADVLDNGYGDCKDKHTLLEALLAAEGIQSYPVLINSGRKLDLDVPSPGQFNHVITAVPDDGKLIWLDTTEEVAPYGFLTASLRDKQALVIGDGSAGRLVQTETVPPFPSMLIYRIKGKVSDDGTLDGNVKMELRGDSELLLRLAFRQAAQDQWKNLVLGLSQVWGLAGVAKDVQVSPTEATERPFDVTYGYTWKNYPNWPDAIKPPLPPINLAELPKDANEVPQPIPIKAPGDYVMEAKIALPKTMSPQLRMAVDVKKDFAEYRATYSWDAGILNVRRDLTVHMREIPRGRSDEYRAFRKAIADDEKSLMTLAGASPASISSSAASADERAEELINLGDTLFWQSDLDGAIATYRKALRLKPDDFRAHRSLADVLYNKREYDQAIAEYREALVISPGDLRAQRTLGDALFNKGEYGQAATEYRKAVRIKPDDFLAQQSLGDALYHQEDWSGAADAYRAAVRLKPDDAEIHSSLGNALFNQHLVREGLAELREAVRLKPDDLEGHRDLGMFLLANGINDEAIKELRAGLRVKPDDTQAHDTLGDALFLTHDPDGAVAEYREALRLKPDDGDAHRGLGDVLLMARHDLKGAIAEYREALRLNPQSNAPAEAGLGTALVREGAMEEGIAELKKAIAEAPMIGDGYETLGYAYRSLHRDDEALETYRQLEKIDPSDDVAPAGIGSILIEKGRLAEAIEELQTAVDRYPPSPQLFLLLGSADIRSGAAEKGMAALDKTLQLDSSPEWLNRVAYELATDNLHLDDALRYANQAVKEQEDDTAEIDLGTLSLTDLQRMRELAADWDTLGWVEFRLGRIDEAEKYLDAAWKLGQFPATGDHLGQFYEKKGDKQQAIRFYALASATGHAPEGTRDRLARLVGSKTGADAAIDAAREKLGQLRTVQVPRIVKGAEKAEFFVLFRSGANVTSAKFISGSDDLRKAVGALASTHFDASIPDDEPVELVRRGILDCPATGANCQFVLLPLESVTSLN